MSYQGRAVRASRVVRGTFAVVTAKDASAIVSELLLEPIAPSIESAAWANGAYDRGDITKYEFWQWVCMDINQRSFEKAAVRRNKH